MAPSIINELIYALHQGDKARPRSMQVEVGPSSIGSCRRQVWHDLQGDPVVNHDTLRLAAIMGTAIHSAIEEAFRVHEDPWRFDLEVEVEHDGLKGHVDCYDKDSATVWDWKTITKKNAASFPDKQKWWQVQVYGWLLNQTGRPVDWVGMVAISRDGNERDLIEVVQPYDEAVALEALAWLAEVKALDGAPEPERDAVSFCRDYCSFYASPGNGETSGTCPGRSRQAKGSSLPLDAEKAGRVRAYVEAKAAADAAAAVLEARRADLEGVAGATDDGWEVSWSARQASSVDREAIKAALGEVPMKAGKESQVISVKQVAA